MTLSSIVLCNRVGSSSEALGVSGHGKILGYSLVVGGPQNPPKNLIARSNAVLSRIGRALGLAQAPALLGTGRH